MGIPQAVRDGYERHRAAYESLERYARDVLRPFCVERGYAFESRIKAVSSLAEKLEGGRTARWSDIDDLVGLTVVVPTLAPEGDVLEFLEKSFEYRNVRSRKHAQTPPEVFRFNATRWYGVVRTDPPPPELEVGAFGVQIEIQVHTVFEHAWSVATREFAFKGDAVNWRERRLAAGIKAMVEQIDAMIFDHQQAAAPIPLAPHPPTDALTSVIATFETLIADGVVDSSLRPTSWSRFSENVYSLVERAVGQRGAAQKVVELVDQLAETVRGGGFTPAVSGSLFQAVLAFVAREKAGWLDRTCVVPSPELGEVYGLDAMPNQFVFDD